MDRVRRVSERSYGRVRNFSSRSLRRLRTPPRPDAPSTCIKYILFFVNVVFWVFGVLILVIGSYLMTEFKNAWNLDSILYEPSVVILIVGILLFLIATVGCIGALRENTILLAIYGGAVTLCLIFLVSAGIAVYMHRDKVVEKLKDDLKHYRDPDKENFQFLIDRLQTNLKCCGVNSYTDWQTNIYFNCSSPGSESCGVPFSCCKESIQLNRQCGYDAGRMKTDAERLEKGVYSKGCWTIAISFIMDNLYLVVGITAAVLILIIVGSCMAFSFRAQIREVQKYAKLHNQHEQPVTIS
ncbi:predicted protein [Nematostella vectensis]|uniref:Tetraspanin n=1 Tax=Nematostella vectensis TaxID=45351 RepID=A7S1M8_NEMVE|nr:predicted protein [Nematostella vectensis]|eukprot:XP_001634450.1 predicted protein [Nematostella vectensis]